LIKKEASIHISNVMLWDAKKESGTKVKRTRENGKLVRVSKKSGEVIK
jgi:large subunit ribosomal protein L24